jgi:hypothetical protein
MKRSSLMLITCLIANIITIPSVIAALNPTNPTSLAFGNDDQEFIFAGSCPNGDKYRIFSYQMDVDGLTQSFYDFDGPAGKGTVRTNVQPKKMAVRVCHELADITSSSQFD